MPQVMYRNFRSRITCLPRPNLNSVVQTETLPLRHYPLAVCVGVWRVLLHLSGWGGWKGAWGVLVLWGGAGAGGSGPPPPLGPPPGYPSPPGPGRGGGSGVPVP